MDNELQAPLEKERIVATINALFVGTDNRDWHRVKTCFTPRCAST